MVVRMASAGQPVELRQEKTRRSLRATISFAIMLAQCFSLFPVQGVFIRKSREMRFCWISTKMFYTFVILILVLVVLSFSCYHCIKEGHTFNDSVEQLFYVNGVCTSFLFIHLARNWPKLMGFWQMVDVAMERKYGFPKNLGLRMKITAFLLMFLATVEHILSIAFHVVATKNEANNTNWNAENYYTSVFPQVFSHFRFSIWAACLVQTVSFFGTFFWNYNDLFIILLSCAVAVRFRQVTEKMKNHGNEASIYYWMEMREDYERLCGLCRKLDGALGYLVLLSFTMNLFFILVQLYHSLSTIEGTVEKIYFFYSFGFLIMRTIAVSLYGAWINDESRKPAYILNALPSNCYNNEVSRWSLQISCNAVALTGCNLFKVTRGLILNIAGAIVTYELVLIQFNQSSE